MADVSNHASVGTLQVPMFRHAIGAVQSLMHVMRLLTQAKFREGDQSAEFALIDGTFVSIAQGFRLDGTTFVVNRHDGTSRRVPASQIVAVCDKRDYGYV